MSLADRVSAPFLPRLSLVRLCESAAMPAGSLGSIDRSRPTSYRCAIPRTILRRLAFEFESQAARLCGPQCHAGVHVSSESLDQPLVGEAPFDGYVGCTAGA